MHGFHLSWGIGAHKILRGMGSNKISGNVAGLWRPLFLQLYPLSVVLYLHLLLAGFCPCFFSFFGPSRNSNGCLKADVLRFFSIPILLSLRQHQSHLFANRPAGTVEIIVGIGEWETHQKCGIRAILSSTFPSEFSLIKFWCVALSNSRGLDEEEL